MEKNNHLEKWVSALKNRGLDQFVATFLEATKPVNFIFAQLVYVGKPMLNGHIESDPVMAFANLLEDNNQMEFFISSLREPS